MVESIEVVDGASGVRASDRIAEAHRESNLSKNSARSRKTRSEKSTHVIYERRMDAVISGLRQGERNYKSLCPDCGGAFSNGFMSRHRRTSHGVVNQQGRHQGYVRVR